MRIRSGKRSMLRGRDVVGRPRRASTWPSNLKIERALGLAQPDGVLGERLEHRLEIERATG